METTTIRRSALAAAVLATAPGAAVASSFQILEQSPSLQGTSFAGTATAAEDATTVFFNPAAMSELEGRTITVGASVILPDADFDNAGSTNSTGVAPLPGPDDTTDEAGVVPSLYYAMPINERWHFGLGINAPFGLATDYDDDWVGRYHATDSELVVLNINPTFSWAATERLSLGFGLDYQRIDATLENEVDSFAACTGAPGATPTACSSTALGTALAPATRSQDSSVEIDGDDDDVTLDLSLLFKFSEDTRVGASYRQGGDFTLDGDADFDQSAACQTNGGCSAVLSTLDGDIEAPVELPDVFTVSATHAVNDRLSLHGDIAYTQWSSIDTIEITNTDNGQRVSELELDYDDTVRVAAGATYRTGGAWTWRGGVAFDEAPQTDATLQTPRVPDEDRTWLSFGFNYAVSEDASIDFGYSHIFVDDIDIDNTDSGSGNTLTGDFDASVDILALQGTLRF